MCTGDECNAYFTYNTYTHIIHIIILDLIRLTSVRDVTKINQTMSERKPVELSESKPTYSEKGSQEL